VRPRRPAANALSELGGVRKVGLCDAVGPAPNAFSLSSAASGCRSTLSPARGSFLDDADDRERGVEAVRNRRCPQGWSAGTLPLRSGLLMRTHARIRWPTTVSSRVRCRRMSRQATATAGGPKPAGRRGRCRFPDPVPAITRQRSYTPRTTDHTRCCRQSSPRWSTCRPGWRL